MKHLLFISILFISSKTFAQFTPYSSPVPGPQYQQSIPYGTLSDGLQKREAIISQRVADVEESITNTMMLYKPLLNCNYVNSAKSLKDGVDSVIMNVVAENLLDVNYYNQVLNYLRELRVFALNKINNCNQ